MLKRHFTTRLKVHSQQHDNTIVVGALIDTGAGRGFINCSTAADLSNGGYGRIKKLDPEKEEAHPRWMTPPLSSHQGKWGVPSSFVLRRDDGHESIGPLSSPMRST